MEQNISVLVNIVNFCFPKLRLVFKPSPLNEANRIAKSNSYNSLPNAKKEAENGRAPKPRGGTIRAKPREANPNLIETLQPPQPKTVPSSPTKPEPPTFLIDPSEPEKLSKEPSEATISSFEAEIDKAGEEALIKNEDPKILYKKGKMVAKGGFGQVYEATDKEKHQVAIKISVHTEKEQRYNIREIGCLTTFKHPNVVMMKEAFLVKNECWIVMEFMQGGTLTQAAELFSLTEPQISYVAKQILIGLEYLHSKSFIHLDLKSGNIMMTTSGEIKLIDFGLCCHSSSGNQRTMAGSPYWMPPEMILRLPYSLPADIWSFAICLLEMANRRPPTRLNKIKAMFITATEGCPTPLTEPGKWSPAFQNFLAQALVFDPEKRATAPQLLSHEFIQTAEGVETMARVLSGVFIQSSIPSVIVE
eukprot:TRINITY_DN2945_c0_g1_i2.p1 TRINITY_DN2945_c0_g1~~TRINITY_DN2945_c0_g1_i2.p1  ORF type:complete len:447 (-),score=87.48 TRINITY_DN2945_c0_g1_i2:221-1474(-)